MVNDIRWEWIGLVLGGEELTMRAGVSTGMTDCYGASGCRDDVDLEAHTKATTVRVDGQEQRRAILLMTDVTMSRIQFSRAQRSFRGATGAEIPRDPKCLAV